MTLAATMEQPPLVQLLLDNPTVVPEDAFAFIGVERDRGYRMLAAYRARVARAAKAGRPFSVDEVKPRRAKDGSWAEIANYKVGTRVRCRSDLLLGMVFPEGAPGTGV